MGLGGGGGGRTAALAPPRRVLLCRPPPPLPPPPSGGGSRPFPCRVAGLRFCVFLRTSAQRGLFSAAPHTHSLSGAESRTQRRHAPHGGERCPLRKGARMQPVQGVTPLPSCSGKRQSHWSARRSERMPRFRFAIFSVRSEMPSCFAKCKDFLGWSWLRQKPAQLVFHLHGLCLHLPCAVQDVVNSRIAEALPLKAMLRMKFKCNGCALRCKAVLVLRDNAERIAAFSAARRSKRFWLKRGSR